MKDLDSQMVRLPMTLLMASSFITYLGIMPEDTRLQMTSLWCKRFIHIYNYIYTHNHASADDEHLVQMLYMYNDLIMISAYIV